MQENDMKFRIVVTFEEERVKARSAKGPRGLQGTRNVFFLIRIIGTHDT